MRLAFLAALLCAPTLHAQWSMQSSNTTADLRGIVSVGGGVAWASGTGGTVLRTEDGGYMWQSCSMPPGAEKLDFRGIQAFDADTAIVMSSGKGALSRIYKTEDGCHTWKLSYTNPEPDGFFDSILKTSQRKLYVLGDPVNGKFTLLASTDSGDSWSATRATGLDSHPDEGSFAASNSELTEAGGYLLFGTGGASNAHIYRAQAACPVPPAQPKGTTVRRCELVFQSVEVPIVAASAASGIFSLAAGHTPSHSAAVVAVGGTYDHPDQAKQSAAYSLDAGQHWTSAQTAPHGYRSSAAYDADLKSWIAVGTNGTDVSVDGGRNWRPVHPDTALHEPADADRNWNAISLPHVVGPKGRIGRLEPAALLH